MGWFLKWGLLQLCQSLVNGLYKQIEQVWGGFDQRLFWIELEEEFYLCEIFYLITVINKISLWEISVIRSGIMM